MADFTIVPGSVLKSTAGNSTIGIAAVAITQGKAVYVLGDGTIGLADSDGTAPANVVAGISQNSASAGQPISYTTDDVAFVPGFTSTPGTVVYLSSDNAGGLVSDYTEINSGATVTIMGVMTSTTVLNLSPVVGGVKA